MRQTYPPAGWYPVGDSERYWDGAGWTEHVRAPSAPGGSAQGGIVHDAHGLPHLAEATAPTYPYADPPPPPSSYYGRPFTAAPAARDPRLGYGPRPYGAYTPYGPVGPRSAGLALVASFFLPGLGTVLNGRLGRGLGILTSWFASWFFFWTLLFTGLVVLSPVFLLAAAATWVWGLVDGYAGAKVWNQQHGFI